MTANHREPARALGMVVRSWAVNCALCVAATALLFFLAEGVASSLYFGYSLLPRSSRPLAETLHTQYDPELGWVNIPGKYVRDMYGPGIYLRINSQGFRNNQDFDAAVPTGKTRVVCSGDSFTLGYGVDNDHTWVSLLSRLDSRIETVNMGQGGYGVDQAYLWYRRDGAKLEQDIHVMALVRYDLPRMRSDSFLGYAKPVLAVENGRLVTRNVPVPKRAPLTRWILGNRHKLRNLRSVYVIGAAWRRLLRRLSPPADSRWEATDNDRLALKVFEDLHEINKRRHSTLVLVYLPTEPEHRGDEDSDQLREFLRRETARRGILFVDFMDEFRELSARKAARLFIPAGSQDHALAAGHYSVDGNQYVAERLYARLKELPAVSGKLSTSAPLRQAAAGGAGRTTPR